MQTTRFEHPLTEQVRTYLRIEFLLQQIEQSQELTSPWMAQSLFKGVIELLELLEQGQLKTEILKDLERQKGKLELWLGVPSVNQDVLKSIISKVSSCSQQLSRGPRLNLLLKDQRLLKSVRQRISIPGGCCSFDLPLFHLWLNKPVIERQHLSHKWWQQLSPLREVITLLLQLIRSSGQQQTHIAKNGFFHIETKDALLLQLNIESKLDIYPIISGNSKRVAIRFLPFNDDSHPPEELSFQLTVFR
ncbi:cell division protein ZapD [Vibrio sp. SS-MA-C1-2]|uniref:cell division protein ZapD n=1 Tax=Vibrio sp. SS-MA-C1-2 TaxID=2908646 RepID=UPI001F19D86A|nr:cell division protein ZapD [Vibrio sp. SS-MA-C1-2]UJF19619.1 cell division protein ZapD [Vibrio sp. SS-MA-C1-2]